MTSAKTQGTEVLLYGFMVEEAGKETGFFQPCGK